MIRLVSMLRRVTKVNNDARRVLTLVSTPTEYTRSVMSTMWPSGRFTCCFVGRLTMSTHSTRRCLKNCSMTRTSDCSLLIPPIKKVP